ncbi:MAG: signal peptidase I [Candidatus Izemoplasma sp.]|nr:signal peptidase I [Candidatus Izemoplasma sp.]
MKNIKENIKIILSVFVIGVLLLYIVLQLFVPDMTIKVFGFKPYIVVTESMEPVLDVNDMVVTRQFDLDEAEIGDIITFNADINYDGTQEVVTHYIYRIEENSGETIIRTNRYFDDSETVVPDTWQLTEDDVLGTHWFQIPYIGMVTEFLKSTIGLITIIVNVGIIATIVYLIKKD